MAPMYGKFLSLVSKAVKGDEKAKVQQFTELFGKGVSKIVKLSKSTEDEDKTAREALNKAQAKFSETHKNPLAPISDDDLEHCCKCCKDCTLFSKCGCGCK